MKRIVLCQSSVPIPMPCSMKRRLKRAGYVMITLGTILAGALHGQTTRPTQTELLAGAIGKEAK